MTFDTSFLVREPEEEYRAKAATHLTSHALKEFRRCPKLFKMRRDGLIADEDRPAFSVGRAAHKLILEGREAFAAAYVVGGPVNPKTGKPFGAKTKAFAEWAAKQEKAVLSEEDARLVERMMQSVMGHAGACALFGGAYPLQGVVEGTVRAELLTGLPCQGRIDFFGPKGGIVDLKTCDDLDWFGRDARKYEYVHQLAFYSALVRVNLDRTCPVHFVVVEKREPFRCGVWGVAEDALVQAGYENMQGALRLEGCAKTDCWPTNYEERREIDRL